MSTKQTVTRLSNALNEIAGSRPIERKFSSSSNFSRALFANRSLANQLLIGLFYFSLSMAAHATLIEVIVDENSGELFFKNSGLITEVIDGYEINSSGGALDPSGLTSISSNYDISGDMSVDAVADWLLIASTASSITEVSPISSSGSIASGQIVSLGELWSPGEATDLEVLLSAGATASATTVDFRDLTADYNGNLIIDQLDYDIFVANYGSTSDLSADGNDDGIVDAADYTVWRDAFESESSISTLTTPAVSPTSFTLAVAVPEPNAIIMIAIGVLLTGSKKLRVR